MQLVIIPTYEETGKAKEIVLPLLPSMVVDESGVTREYVAAGIPALRKILPFNELTKDIERKDSYVPIEDDVLTQVDVSELDFASLGSQTDEDMQTECEELVNEDRWSSGSCSTRYSSPSEYQPSEHLPDGEMAQPPPRQLSPVATVNVAQLMSKSDVSTPRPRPISPRASSTGDHPFDQHNSAVGTSTEPLLPRAKSASPLSSLSPSPAPTPKVLGKRPSPQEFEEVGHSNAL